MKQTITKFMGIAALLLLSATAAFAEGTVTIVKQLNGTANESAGTVEYVVNQSNNQCQLTISPAEGNYITAEYITVEKLVSGNLAQSRRAPGLSEAIEVTATDATANASGTTTYTFQMPSSSYDVEVTANFQSRLSISDAAITLAETTFSYNGEAKEPAVSSVVLYGATLATTDYAVSYSNNTNAGTATVTVTGQGKYTDEATTEFTIGKAALSRLSVSILGWTYGEYNEVENVPTVKGNEGEGTITFYYKAVGANDSTTTIPENAGNYILRASVAETDNYAAGTATAQFTIAKADPTFEIEIDNWTYGSSPSEAIITGTLGEATVVITYSSDTYETSTTAPTNAGRYTVTGTTEETANYNARETQTMVTIEKANLSGVTIADIDDQAFTGSQLKPAITVTFNGNPVDATEYNVVYGENINVGNGTVSLTSKNVNFYDGQETPSKAFNIIAAAATITAANDSVIYNGQAQEYTKGSVDKGSLIVTYYNNEEDRTEGNALEGAPTNAGVYYVQLTQGNANYSSEPVNVTFTINAKTLTDDMVSVEDEMFIYDGTEKTLESISVYDAELKYELTGDDFDVDYEANTNVGTAAAYITGKGNYQGQIVKFFQIMRELNVSFNGNSWATYYAEEDLATPEGIDAYIVTAVDGNEVTAEQIEYIPLGVAVLLYAPEVMEMVIAEAWQGESVTFDNNLLQGSTTATAVSGLTAQSDIYVLYNDEFVKTTTGTIPANRSYLALDKAANAAGARSLSIVFASEETGIAEISGTAVADGQYYNMQGMRMAQPQKGLVIVNGKKMFVK